MNNLPPDGGAVQIYVPEPVLLSAKERIHPKKLDFLRYSVTYCEDFLPLILVEDRATTYYSTFDEEHIYYQSRQEAEQGFAQHLEKHFVYSDKRLIVEHYGVQEHHEVIPVYRIDYAPMREIFPGRFHDSTPNISSPMINPEKVREYFHRLTGDFRELERQYSETFGYTSFHVAKKYEPYLTKLLSNYSIHHIFDVYTQHFGTLSKELRATYEHSSDPRISSSTIHGDVFAKDIGSFIEHQNYLTRREVILQRYIMRAIFDAPMIHEKIHHFPLSWIVATVDHDHLKTTVYENMCAHFEHDPEYFENLKTVWLQYDYTMYPPQ